MTKPRGTEEVARSLIEVAAEEYAGGRAVSVRRVAQRAGVNHGQIHHLFGGKEGLKRAMLDAMAADMDAQIAAREPEDLLALIRETVAVCLEDDRIVRALARQILEDDPADIAQMRFPVVSRLRASIDDLGLEFDGVEVYLAEGLARGLGWVLFRDWIRRATGLSESGVAEVERRLGDPLASIPVGGPES